MTNITDRLRAAFTPAVPSPAPDVEPVSPAIAETLEDPPETLDPLDSFSAAAPGDPGPYYRTGQPGGGYPPMDNLISRPDPANIGRPNRIEPVRAWSSQRLILVGTTPSVRAQALLVTPAGIDADTVHRVTLVCNTANGCRFGPTENEARVGAFIPPGTPGVTLSTGPVYVFPELDCAVDVIVETRIKPPCKCHGGGDGS